MKHLRNKLISISILIAVSLPVFCQTGLGSLTHIANSAGNAALEDSALKGQWTFSGFVGKKDACLRELEKAFIISGFMPGEAALVFSNGASFAIMDKDNLVPGTWKEITPGKVRIGFSKIFTYGITGDFSIQDEFCTIKFTKDEFIGLAQRMLAILGRHDTGKLMQAASDSKDTYVTIRLNNKKGLPLATKPKEAMEGAFRLSSPLINAAIDSVSRCGGGTVFIPAGVHYCHSIRLKSNIRLYLENGAVIKAAPPVDGLGFDKPEPAINDKYQGFGHIHVHNSLIWGTDLENVTICGSGMIDGSVLDSWTEGGPGHGNKAIGLRNCRNVTIKDITILRGGHFAIHATAVDNLKIDNVTIDSDRDGIDIICCKGVTIKDCYVNTPEDDSIVLKSTFTMGYFRDVEDVSISGCHISGFKCGTLLDGTRQRFPKSYDTFRSGGRIKLGTESSGGYRNIKAENCTFEYCGGILLESEDGGVMDGVSVSNMTMRDPLSSPIFIRLGARMRSPGGTPVGKIRNIEINGIEVRGAQSWTSCIITGIPGHYVENICLKNIHISAEGGYYAKDGKLNPPEFEKDYPEPWMFGTTPSKGIFIRHAKNILIDNVNFDFLRKDGRPLYVEKDTENIQIN